MKSADGVATVAPVKHWCETCEGLGTIDERLGGESFSNPKAPCPDCDGQGWWTPRAAAGVTRLDGSTFEPHTPMDSEPTK